MLAPLSSSISSPMRSWLVLALVQLNTIKMELVVLLVVQVCRAGWRLLIANLVQHQLDFTWAQWSASIALESRIQKEPQPLTAVTVLLTTFGI